MLDYLTAQALTPRHVYREVCSVYFHLFHFSLIWVIPGH